jgi:hypothetical protein
MDLSGTRTDTVHRRKQIREIILDPDSLASEIYGDSA